jgi:hypothetical protein
MLFSHNGERVRQVRQVRAGLQENALLERIVDVLLDAEQNVVERPAALGQRITVRRFRIALQRQHAIAPLLDGARLERVRAFEHERGFEIALLAAHSLGERIGEQLLVRGPRLGADGAAEPFDALFARCGDFRETQVAGRVERLRAHNVSVRRTGPLEVALLRLGRGVLERHGPESAAEQQRHDGGTRAAPRRLEPLEKHEAGAKRGSALRALGRVLRLPAGQIAARARTELLRKRRPAGTRPHGSEGEDGEDPARQTHWLGSASRTIVLHKCRRRAEGRFVTELPIR